MIHVAPPSAQTRVRHQIRSGESLSTIAEKYGIRVADIRRVNRLSSSTIIAGEYLTIEYSPGKKTTTVRTKSTPTTSKDVIQYKVVSGDTLGEIAERFHVSVKSIRKLNKLRSSKIVEGKTLLIPKT